ncbi:MAG: DUF1501 domain-containing protein [Fimbriiglobus sp.]
MLTLQGARTRFCDGITRRNALKIGTFAFGTTALTLADISRIEAATKKEPTGFRPTRHKALINVFLGGGPPHQDMFDLKPDAPSEIRGEFHPINTNVPGIEICEVFPRIAKMMDKFAIVRSLVGARGGHDAIQATTGQPEGALAALGGAPSIGSTVSKLLGPVDPSVPPFVGLADRCGHMPWADSGKPGFLGGAYGAFKPNGPDMANMRLNTTNNSHLRDRKELLGQFDTLRRELDAGGALKTMDAHTERAMNVLLSSKLLDALDLTKEDPRIVDRYGNGKPYKYQYDGTPTANEQFLLARRLIEAGARVVTLNYGRWDSHSKNFDLVRDHGSKLDQALSTLIWDLERLDMLQDVTVVVWGEFGRTPRINKEAGRDHWPQVSCALLAGGGIKTGQIVGSTNRLGEYAKDRPVTFGEMFATLYTSMGLNPHTNSILDPTGRPQHLAEGAAIRELV